MLKAYRVTQGRKRQAMFALGAVDSMSADDFDKARLLLWLAERALRRQWSVTNAIYDGETDIDMNTDETRITRIRYKPARQPWVTITPID